MTLYFNSPTNYYLVVSKYCCCWGRQGLFLTLYLSLFLFRFSLSLVLCRSFHFEKRDWRKEKPTIKPKVNFWVLAGVSNKQYTIVTSPAWKMLFTIIMTQNKNLGSSHITCALWLEEYLHKCESTYHWANKQLRCENLFLAFSWK